MDNLARKTEGKIKGTGGMAETTAKRKTVTM